MAFRTEKAGDSDYGLLGVEPGASRAEVKAAYRRLAKEWHPDRFHERSLGERRLAEEKFKALTSAYRRIAGGWLEEEPVGEKRQSRVSTPFESRGTARPSPATGRRGAGRTIGFSWPAPGWKHLATGLLLALGAALFVFRFQSSTDRHGVASSVRPSEVEQKTLSPAPAAVPDSGLGMAPRDLPQPEASAPAEPPRDWTRPPIPEPLSPPGGSPPAAASTGFLTLGSTQEEVLRIQGPPQVIRGLTWVYGVSDLGFKDGRVVRFNNFDGSLKVRVIPSRSMPVPPPSFFTIGSSSDEVLAVQGTPTRVEGHRWMYGFSEIRFKEGRVEEYDNFFGNLNIQLLPARAPRSGPPQHAFTVGSTADEVLIVQGTPTSIRGNLWYYEMSSVIFRKGKVQYVHNSSGNLRFEPKEDLTRNE